MSDQQIAEERAIATAEPRDLERAKTANDLWHECNEAAAQLKTHAQVYMARAFKLGKYLATIQEAERGGFVAWIEQHCQFSTTHAYRFIRVFKHQSQLTPAIESGEVLSLRDAEAFVGAPHEAPPSAPRGVKEEAPPPVEPPVTVEATVQDAPDEPEPPPEPPPEAEPEPAPVAAEPDAYTSAVQLLDTALAQWWRLTVGSGTITDDDQRIYDGMQGLWPAVYDRIGDRGASVFLDTSGGAG